MDELLVSGMFRSGTTLVSRILSAHPAALVVSDPYVYFFKALRDHHRRALGLGAMGGRPTPHWFLDPDQVVLQAIQGDDLSAPIDPASQERIRADVAEWKSAQHPALVTALEGVRGETWRDFFSALLAALFRLYGDDTVRILGTKVSWCDEFIPALARAMPRMRFVLVVRDVRAMVASQNRREGAGSGKRPLLFYLRHWRKSVALTARWLHDTPWLAERVHMLRYEDLARAPEPRLRELCGFLGLEWCSRMLTDWTDPARGDSWTHNSTFRSGAEGRGISTTSIDRWRSVLTPAEVAAIEAYAGPELAWLGYPLSPTIAPDDAWTRAGVEPPFDQLSRWLQPFPEAQYLRSPAGMAREYAAEILRRSMLEGRSTLEGGAVPAALMEPMFFGEAHYHRLRAAWQAARSERGERP